MSDWPVVNSFNKSPLLQAIIENDRFELTFDLATESVLHVTKLLPLVVVMWEKKGVKILICSVGTYPFMGITNANWKVTQ